MFLGYSYISNLHDFAGLDYYFHSDILHYCLIFTCREASLGNPLGKS